MGANAKPWITTETPSNSKGRGTELATICADDRCNDFLWADFSVVIKIHQKTESEYSITNVSEHNLADSLAPGRISKQGILTLNASGAGNGAVAAEIGQLLHR